MANLRIRAEGTNVQLIHNGRLVADMPWQAAEQVACAFREAAKKAEEQDKAPLVAGDQALLLRAGIPLGLTRHPHIQHEAINQALYDPKLRRYLPTFHGIPSQGVVGTPDVVQHPLKGGGQWPLRKNAPNSRK